MRDCWIKIWPMINVQVWNMTDTLLVLYFIKKPKQQPQNNYT